MNMKQNCLEAMAHGIFLILGLVTVACVLLITAYLVVSGIPAICEIGIGQFLFGVQWASAAAEPKFGILPFILTSIYGTAGAILLGVPVGFLTAVYLAKMAPRQVKQIVGQAVSMLAGIPSVVYGLVGMMVLVPGIRKLFRLPHRRPCHGAEREVHHRHGHPQYAAGAADFRLDGILPAGGSGGVRPDGNPVLHPRRPLHQYCRVGGILPDGDSQILSVEPLAFEKRTR